MNIFVLFLFLKFSANKKLAKNKFLTFGKFVEGNCFHRVRDLWKNCKSSMNSCNKIFQNFHSIHSQPFADNKFFAKN